MARVKYNKSGRTDSSNMRLKLIDKILSENKRIPDRKIFRQKINAELTDDKQVSFETLDKDIKHLRQLIHEKNCDVQLKFKKNVGYYYSQEGFKYFDHSINQDDKPTLILAQNLFSSLAGSVLEPKFNEIVNKILELSIEENDEIDKDDIKYISIANSTSDQGVKWIEPLLKAIYQKDALLITYKSLNKEPRARVISPYLLRYHNERWYLVAGDHNSPHTNKEIIFALERISSIEFSNKPYQISEANLIDFFKYSIGVWQEHEKLPQKIVLAFSQYKEYIITTPLHHSQKISYDNTSNDLIVEITVYESPELYKLILGFGEKVKVLEPQFLVENIKNKIAQMAMKYSEI
jgi:predicted DNA-binding transcriptional regulator YafY